MKNVVIYYTSTLEFELPDANMAMGNGNPFELVGITWIRIIGRIFKEESADCSGGK